MMDAFIIDWMPVLDRTGADRLDHDEAGRVGAAGAADRVDARLEVHVEVRLRRGVVAATGLFGSLKHSSIRWPSNDLKAVAICVQTAVDLGGHGRGGAARRGNGDPLLAVRVVVGVDEDVHAGVDRPLRRLRHLGHPRRVDRVRGRRADVIRPGHGNPERVEPRRVDRVDQGLIGRRVAPAGLVGRGVERVPQVPAGRHQLEDRLRGRAAPSSRRTPAAGRRAAAVVPPRPALPVAPPRPAPPVAFVPAVPARGLAARPAAPPYHAPPRRCPRRRQLARRRTPTLRRKERRRRPARPAAGGAESESTRSSTWDLRQ